MYEVSTESRKVEFIKFLPEGRVYEASAGNRNGENMRFLPEEGRESV